MTSVELAVSPQTQPVAPQIQPSREVNYSEKISCYICSIIFLAGLAALLWFIIVYGIFAHTDWRNRLTASKCTVIKSYIEPKTCTESCNCEYVQEYDYRCDSCSVDCSVGITTWKYLINETGKIETWTERNQLLPINYTATCYYDPQNTKNVRFNIPTYGEINWGYIVASILVCGVAIIIIMVDLSLLAS
jgi:hypothetical protein